MHSHQPKQINCQEYKITENQDFLRMLCPLGLSLAAPYLKEEEQQLTTLIQKEHLYSNRSFIAVGAGPLIHLDIANSFNQTYIGIDPLIDDFMDKTDSNLTSGNKILTINFLNFTIPRMFKQ